MALESYQERVVHEKSELEAKITLLHSFITRNVRFSSLSPAEQRRMKRQAIVMGLYRDVLEERIEAF